MAAKIKKGDKVVVLSGRDRGAEGEVLKVDPKADRVTVQGVNIIKRHTKPSQTSAGGIISREAPIHVSNVAIADPKDGKPTRVKIKTLESGERVRVASRSGEQIDT